MAHLALFVVKGFAALNEGAQKRKLGYQQYKALHQASQRRAAAATADAAGDVKTKEYIESKALAHAAAGGGGIDDPTVQNLIGDLNAEGQYRVMARLYTGMTEAGNIRSQADAARRGGDAALDVAYMKAAKTVLSTMSDPDEWGAIKDDWGKIKDRFGFGKKNEWEGVSEGYNG